MKGAPMPGNRYLKAVVTTLIRGNASAFNTALADTFNEALLCQQIDDNQRHKSNHRSSRQNLVAVCGRNEVTTGARHDIENLLILVVQTFYNAGQTVCNGIPSHTSCKEDFGINTIGPPPNKCKQETGNHHRSCTGKKDVPEGAELTATVYPCCFLKFFRLITEMLTHHVNVKAALVTGENRASSQARPQSPLFFSVRRKVRIRKRSKAPWGNQPF